MGRNFDLYKVNLDFFYRQVLGSKNQAFIEKGYEYLQGKLNSRDGRITEVIADLYRYQLEQLVNSGQFEGGYFPWENYTFRRVREDMETELEISTKIDVIKTLFSLDSSFEGYGGFGYNNYQYVFKNIQKVLRYVDQEAQLWKFLLEGRPLPGDKNYMPGDGYTYYTYLTNAELQRLFGSIEKLQGAEGVDEFDAFDYVKEELLQGDLFLYVG